MTESLFDYDIARVDASPQRYAERTYDFYNRVAGPLWQRVRELIDTWWRDHPDDARSDIRGRIRNGDTESLMAAFFEMYTYQVLRRVSVSVEAHPSVVSSRRPDFIAELDDGIKVVVEVTSTGTSDAAKAQSRRLMAVYDAINSVEVEHFVFMVDPQKQGERAHRTSHLKRELAAFAADLDYDAIRESWDYGAGYFDDRAPRYTWTSDDWSIQFLAIPRPRDGGGGPTVGMHAPIVTWGDPAPIRAKIRDKATAYGDIDSAFVVAVLAPALHTDDESVAAVLYGDSAIEIDPDDPTRPGRQYRIPNGAWHGGDQWKRPNMSAVLFARDLAPWSVATTVPTLWHHPAAAAGVDDWYREGDESGRPVEHDRERPAA